MLICDHRFGFKRRDDSGYYCPLCRVSVTLGNNGNELNLDISEDHIVNFDETGYGLQHPLVCRPNLLDCIFNQYLADSEKPDMVPGQYIMRWNYGVEEAEYTLVSED